MIQKYFEIEADQRIGLKFQGVKDTHDNNGKRYPIANPEVAQNISNAITDVWYNDPKNRIIATINSDESVNISVVKSIPLFTNKIHDNSDPVYNYVRELLIGTLIGVVFFIVIGSLPA